MATGQMCRKSPKVFFTASNLLRQSIKNQVITQLTNFYYFKFGGAFQHVPKQFSSITCQFYPKDQKTNADKKLVGVVASLPTHNKITTIHDGKQTVNVITVTGHFLDNNCFKMRH